MRAPSYPTTAPASRPRVLLVCSGLDHARRGFESFARECFEVLRDDPGVDIELVKGSGPPGPGERSIPSMRRNHPVVQALSRLSGARAYRIEALTFAFSVQPVVARRQPDVIYLSEWDTARALARLRSLTRQHFKLLLCNGTLVAEGFEHLDRVQDLTPAAHEYVLERGADPARHTVLPLGVHIEREFVRSTAAERLALRQRLGLPEDRTIVLSVAALNRQVKRLDYLIEEVAALPQPRPFVLMVGEGDADTPTLRSLTHQRLGEDGFDIRTVRPVEVPDLYRASDVFVLASLVESQGRALIEAAANGIPCVAHDYPITRYALADYGIFGDFTRSGSLTGLLREHAAANPEIIHGLARAARRHVYERFSWERLRPRYVELLKDVARAERRENARPG